MDDELNPWLAAGGAVRSGGQRGLGLDNGLCKVLRMPSKEITVHIPVQFGRREVGSVHGYRVAALDSAGAGERRDIGSRRT